MPRGFVLHSTYRNEGGRPVVCLSGKLESGESFLLRDGRSEPHFWVRHEDSARAAQAGAKIRDPKRPLVTLHGEPVARVDVARPQDTPPLRDELHRLGISTFEADVRFAHRYLIDRGIRASLEIDGPSRPGDGIDLVFEDPDVRPADWTPLLRVLSIDIETDPSANRLLSVALVGSGASDVLLLTPRGWDCPPGAVACTTERELLQTLVRRVKELDPDVLTGWNFVDFDLTVLAKISERLGVPLPLGRGPAPITLRPSLSPRATNEARMSGRLALDGIELVRGAFLRFESYGLDAVAREVLGRAKTISGSDRAGEILEAFRSDREKLVEYNRNDARLALDILEKLQLVELAVERSRLTGLAPDRVAASVSAFDFLYLSELGRRGVVAPTVRPWTEEDGPGPELAGGHVLEPVPGLWRNVLVFDFASLYPSVIRTFQIDPLGYLPSPAPEDDPIVAPNGAAFRREPGILPRMLDELFPRRAAAKKSGNVAASQAIKILMNSFYGVLGTPVCRFASPPLANAITSFGREILLWSKAWFEEEGFRVLYGDTDSLFVESKLDDSEAAQALGAELAPRLDRDLDRHIANKWQVESKLELEFETLYVRLLLPVTRGGTAGARKRYVGLERSDGEPRLVFTGMEVVRRDWTELAKRVQRELYTRLFDDRPVDDYLCRVVEELRSGGLDDLLVYRKSLRKRLDSYTASTPPHVAAARKMSSPPGRIVEYLMTSNGPEPAAERQSALDREHYVQKQVRAVADPVLTLLGLEFDRIVGDDRQLELF
jgi:DNA polymerase-2